MLQMIVKPTATPEPISWNYDELKAELTEALAGYEAHVYTEADIPLAKKERATLNQLKTALNEERIRREKEYMIPFATFKAQVKELCELIDHASQSIGTQLDAMEEKRKAEKRGYIEGLYETCVCKILSVKEIPDWLPLDRVLDERWYNKTFTMKMVQQAIEDILHGIVRDTETLLQMGDFDAVEFYKRTLDINEAIKCSRELAEIKANAEKGKTAREKPKTDVTPVWLSFRALVDYEKATALAKFCKDNGIKLEPIKEV